LSRLASPQRLSQWHGEVGEFMVRGRLTSWGLLMVEKIHVPWKIIRGANGVIVRAVPLEKVSGDFRAMMPGGRSVLCEVKSREDGPLSLSDFEDHQHRALIAHAAGGGLSLVAWCRPAACMIFERRDAIAAGWAKGSPLHLDDGLRIADACHARIVQAIATTPRPE
jgi:hypothetical protein